MIIINVVLEPLFEKSYNIYNQCVKHIMSLVISLFINVTMVKHCNFRTSPLSSPLSDKISGDPVRLGDEKAVRFRKTYGFSMG